MKLKVKYLENYNTDWDRVSSKEGDSGYDLRAAISEPVVLLPNERKVIPNGIKCELDTSVVIEGGLCLCGGMSEKDLCGDKIVVDTDVEIQIRPRSGLAAKNGITVVNAPGTVDYNYRGELMTILLNTSTENFVINPGDRISQMVICPIYKPIIVDVEEITDSNRGINGLGSSGV